ncbi:hypothetical protein SDC9_63085 [bioreactor metagenome]|uniref:Uncharacterized protein n=1 Tax=bioreactor metagenome TaxID=1076179 RepID=A0A644XRF6_9ZZZZ
MQRCPVEPGPVGPAGVDVDLQHQRPVVVAAGPHPGLHRGPLGAVPHQRQVGGDPVGAEGGQVVHRLHQVGLALTVGPDEGHHTRLQVDIDVRVRPEVGQCQVVDVHQAQSGRRISMMTWR